LIYSWIYVANRRWFQPQGWRALRRPHAAEELVDLGLQMQAFTGQRLRRLEHAAGGLAGLAGTARDIANIDGHALGARGRGADALGDVRRRRALLLHRRRDRVGDLADALDGLADSLDGGHRLLGRKLHAGDLAGNFVGGFRGLPGERLDLLGHDRETAAGITRTRRFDG